MDNLEKQVLIKRFQTTMIGALFEFEKAFGYLWGHDKNENDLTERELDFQDRWDHVRHQILNNGNSQMRKAISDLENMKSTNTKYTYKFYTKKEDNL
jgi:hypothetical protein